ncbi:hypothetical protein DRQ33_08610 [bacterium]|nr:MAG: hypothetical protein DRQ33_08610 [bacterium]
MRARKGLMLLDVIIIILVVGVIATLVVPHIRTEEKVKIRDECRQRMLLFSEAQLKYFETGGGMIKPAETDSTDTSEVKDEQEREIPRVFTRDIQELKKMLPEEFKDTRPICPLDGRQFVIVARDSFFYSISCPNGHGQIIMGTPTWKEGE